MDNLKYCAACLVTNVRMYNLDAKHNSNSSSTLGRIFSRLLQIPTFEKNHYVCFECTRLMYRFREFKTKCQKAQSLLANLRMVDDSETVKKIIKNVDRKFYKLTSNLSLSSIKITDTSNDIESDNEIIDETQELIIKTENEELTNSNMINTNTLYDENDSMHNKDLIESVDECDGEIEYLYSEDSLDSDNIVLIKENSETKTKSPLNMRKRKIADSIKTVDIENDFSDDEPLSKVSKDQNSKTENVKNKNPKNFNFEFFKDFATVVFMTPADAKNELLLRKESSNYQKCRFKCEFCYKGFEGKTTFENHMKRHSVEHGEYKCDVCHLRYPERKLLGKHRLACHKRKFFCKVCSYVCYCTDQAKTHVSLHLGKKYPCQECDEVFNMPNSLLMHKRIKHVAECVCELCGSTFTNSRGLYVHNNILHRQDVNDKQGPKCDECGIHFATETAWKRHLVLSSKHSVSNGCKHCGETFSNEEELKYHTKVHARKQPPRPFRHKSPSVCSICDKWLADHTEYKRHMMSEHPQFDDTKEEDPEEQTSFVCEICGQMFQKHHLLTYHQRSKHTDERPYKCVSCDKSFSLPGALASHRANVHQRGRTHLCLLCGHIFTFRSGLNKHMKAHLDIRPHKCTMCDKAFISPCDRKLHIKYVHNKVPWPKRDRKKRKKTEENV